MREILEELFSEQPIDPVEAARRNARIRLRDRFYRDVTVADDEGGFAVRLDGRVLRTPGRHMLATPSREIAAAIAAEWDVQREHIDPASMPLTRLANTVIDGVTAAKDEVAAEIAKYLGADLLCYRADSPPSLVARQARQWDPIIAWSRDALGARFVLVEGVTFSPQSEGAIAAAAAAIPRDPWRLGAAHVVTTLTGSALIALALTSGAIDIEEAWSAAHVDEDWQMEQWGRDEIALERQCHRRAEFDAAATILTALT